MTPKIEIPQEWVAEFCKNWKISEFALFGSVLSDDFRPDSDVDVLLTFADDSNWSLFDIVDMQEELKQAFGRDVDIVEKPAIRNPYRRRRILGSAQVLYAA